MAFTMMLMTEEGKSIVGGFDTLEEGNAFAATMGFDAEDVTFIQCPEVSHAAESMFEDVPF